MKTTWIGPPAVGNNDPYQGAVGWIKGVEIGLREDGMVIWREEKPENKMESLTSGSVAELQASIKSYLCNGGLFNPEMMEHSKVRDLLLEASRLMDVKAERCNLR